MQRLLTSSGSNEIIRVGGVPEEIWAKTRSHIENLLRGRKLDRALKIFRKVPWRLFEGTNAFGDEFYYLHAVVDIDKYVALGEKETDTGFRQALSSIKRTIEEITEYHIRFMTVALSEKLEEHPTIDLPDIEAPDTTLKRCIDEFRETESDGRFLNCIDRLHTAFHAFLKSKAEGNGLTVGPRDGINEIYKALRGQFELTENDRVLKVLKTSSNIVHQFNEIRNHNSLAHPSEDLLDEDDALFIVNTVSALFHYLNAKI